MIEDRIQAAIMAYAVEREPEMQIRMMSSVSFWFINSI